MNNETEPEAAHQTHSSVFQIRLISRAFILR